MRSINRPDDPAFAKYGFDAARECAGDRAQLFASGQIGDPHADMATQVGGALDNLAAVLGEAGYELGDIVRLGIYTKDVEAFLAAWPVARAAFAPAAVPPNTLVQVVRFAHPSVLVEIDAVAVH